VTSHVFVNDHFFTGGSYLCRRCGWRYSTVEAVHEHVRRQHQVWNCGDFTVEAVVTWF
jgi:hypothetical protein